MPTLMINFDADAAWRVTRTWIVAGPSTAAEALVAAVGEPDDTSTERVDHPYCVGSGMKPTSTVTRESRYVEEIDHHIAAQTRGTCCRCDDKSVLVTASGRLRKHPAVDHSDLK